MTCDEIRDLAPAFVLGALDPDEEAAVRDHLASCPEPHPEFAELGGVVPYLAETVEQVEPSEGLKDRILAAAAADLASAADARGGTGLVVAFPRPGDAAQAAEPAVAVPASRTSGRAGAGAWLVRIAAAVVIVALGAWNLLLQSQVRDARSYEDGVAAALELAAEPGSQAAILAAPVGDGPRGLAAVGADGSVVLAMRDLPATTGTEVYEAWVIGADGVPVPIGGQSVGATGTLTLTAATSPAGPGVTLALTREPGPGATTPTLPILSIGVASAPPT